MSPSETIRLIKVAQHGPLNLRLWARNQVITGNMRLVFYMARRVIRRNSTAPFEDLVQAAAMGGLIRAIEKFDTTRGLKFSTYAVPWIRAALGQALADWTGEGTYGRGTAGRCSKARRIAGRAALRSGSHTVSAAVEAATESMGMTPECAEKLLKLQPAHSLDGLRYHGHGSPDGGDGLHSGLPTCGGETEAVAAIDTKRAVTRALQAMRAQLPRKSVQVLQMRFGLAGYREHTLAEIGREFGVSRERIRQIEAQALQVLRGTLGARSS